MLRIKEKHIIAYIVVSLDNEYFVILGGMLF